MKRLRGLLLALALGGSAHAGLEVAHQFIMSRTYDTVLGVWTGSRGSLSNVECNDDIGGGVYQSQVQFVPAPGTTYYIEVADWNAPLPDSQLVLNVTGPQVPQEMTFYSAAAYDGETRESGEDTSKGGSANAAELAIPVGDDNQNRQYRAILHFDTSALPDNAVVTGVTLRIKKVQIIGATPFTTHGYLKVDMRTGAFHDDPTLEKLDFHAIDQPVLESPRRSSVTRAAAARSGVFSGVISSCGWRP